MTIIKVKSVYGSVAYVDADDLVKARANNRLVRLRDRYGVLRTKDGETCLYNPGNLLTDTDRKVERRTVRYPGGTAAREYRYAD